MTFPCSVRAFLPLAVLACVACGQTEPAGPAGDGQVADNTRSDEKSSALDTSSATKIVVSDLVDGMPFAPGSACEGGRVRRTLARGPAGTRDEAWEQWARYTLDIATGALGWERCESASESGPYRVTAGSAALGRTDLQVIDDLLEELRISEAPRCGGESATLTLAVSRPAGDIRYGDASASQCPNGVVDAFVTGIHPIFRAVDEGSRQLLSFT